MLNEAYSEPKFTSVNSDTAFQGVNGRAPLGWIRTLEPVYSLVRGNGHLLKLGEIADDFVSQASCNHFRLRGTCKIFKGHHDQPWKLWQSLPRVGGAFLQGGFDREKTARAQCRKNCDSRQYSEPAPKKFASVKDARHSSSGASRLEFGRSADPRVKNRNITTLGYCYNDRILATRH